MDIGGVLRFFGGIADMEDLSEAIGKCNKTFCTSCNEFVSKICKEFREELQKVKAKYERVENEMESVKRELEDLKNKEKDDRKEVEEVKRGMVEVKKESVKEVDEIKRNMELFKKETVPRKEVENVREVMEEIKRDGKREMGEVKRNMELMKKEVVMRMEVEEVKKAMEEIRKDGVLKKDVEEEVKRSFADIVASEKENEEKLENSKAKQREVEMKVREVMERDKRRMNLVIMGLQEKDEDADKEEIRKIMDALVPENMLDFEVVGRIGRKSEKERPVRVRMLEFADKRRILIRAKLLKQKEEYARVYIVPDLTRLQQEEDKKLRMEVKTRRNEGGVNVRIVGGKVVEGNGGEGSRGSVNEAVSA